MRERLDRVWPSLAALAGTVAVVVALLVLFGDNTGGTSGDAAASDQSDRVEPGTEAATDGTGTSGQPTGEPTTAETDGAQPAETETGGETADPDEESGAGPTTAPPELRSPLGIANQTSIEGLELVAQDRIEAGGWEVAATSGFQGDVPETTVYYPPGMEEYAQALARQFPEIGRVMPTFEGLNDTRLVVILVEDYATEIQE